MTKQSANALMRNVGIAVLTGTLVFAQVPVAAFAEDAGAGQAPQSQDGGTPPEKPSGEQGTDGQPGEPPSGEALMERRAEAKEGTSLAAWAGPTP